jgi:hypothetical protein
MDESAESYDLRKANNNVIRWPEHREFFASQNGDRWFVGRHKTTMNGYIIHKANESSGGACTEMEVEAFLRRTPPRRARIRRAFAPDWHIRRAVAQFKVEIMAREKTMADTNRFNVSISSLNGGLNDDRQSLAGHTLTVTPDGSLAIIGEQGRHTLAPGAWDDLELKMLPTLDKTSLADIG